jgi:hypothetical protein
MTKLCYLLLILLMTPKYFSVLQVGLKSDVSRAGFVALSKLPHLQQFIFGDSLDWQNWRREFRYLRFCTEYLPQLRVAGRSFDVMDADDWHTCGADRVRGYHNELLQHLQQPKAQSLQLFLNLAEDFLTKPTVTYPKVEELLLWEPSERMLRLLGKRFTSLTVLGLYDCDETNVLPVLHQFGQRLHTLVLDLITCKVSLAKVLQLCPRLKRFKVCSCEVNTDPEQCSEGAFSYMEEAYFKIQKIPTGFLKQVNA